MKRILLFLCLLLPLCTYAQLALKAEMSQANYLLFEPVYVKITMRNMTGHTLVFGESSQLSGSLQFKIRMPDSVRYVLPMGELPSLKGIILQPGTTRSFIYNVTAFYSLKHLGHHALKAVITHPHLDSSYESNLVHFSIVGGMDIWKSLVGIPSGLSLQENEKIATRQYRIVKYFSGRDFYYVLLIEDPKRIYLVRRIGLDLGPHLGPKCAVDDQSHLNMVIAGSQKVFAYYQFDVTGKLLKQEVRIKTETTPKLVVNKEFGTVVFTGGRQARRDTDYEELKELPFITKGMTAGDAKDITGGTSLVEDEEPLEK